MPKIEREDVKRGPMELAIEQELVNGELNDAQREKAKETLDALLNIMTEYRTALGHINNDGRLSASGKQFDTAELKQSTDSRIASVGDSRLESLDKRIAELLVFIRQEPPASDPKLEYMKQAEARQCIRETFKDELSLQSEYMQWTLNGGSDLLMRAVENSPLPMLSDPAVLEDGKRARGERTNSDNAQTLRQLEQVRSTIASTINAYRTELGRQDLMLEKVAQAGAA